MFKAIRTLLGREVAPGSIALTPSMLNRRHTLCNHLVRVYGAQIALLDKPHTEILRMVGYYQGLGPEYLKQLEALKEYMNAAAGSVEPITEADFRAVIEPQIANTTEQLETINDKIQVEDLVELDKGYSPELDKFFQRFHLNRIAALYAMREYLSTEPLLKNARAADIVTNGIKTTSQMLGLNGYPVPRFIFDNAHSDVDLSITCVPAHVVHVMFEMFKNASIPSLNRQRPISVSVYRSNESVPLDHVKTDLHERKFTVSSNRQPNVSCQDMVTIEIRDDGGGMPMETVEKIWQFHYTTSNDVDRDTIHGFGMGLPLCRVFAHFNDGNLTLENREGEGVTVRITLPSTE